MMPLPPRAKPGDEIQAAHFNALRGAIIRNSILAGDSSGVELVQTEAGTTISVSLPLRFVGVANGNISPRSGSAWGTGTVTRYWWDGTSDHTAYQDFTVVNPSSSTMTSGHGIDSGQYCWVEEDSDGNLVVTPLECS